MASKLGLTPPAGMAQQTVFITNFTGYIGSVIGEKLLKKSYKVVALVRDQHKADAAAEKGVTPFIGDISDPLPIAQAAAKADGVIHTAYLHNGDFKTALAWDTALVRAFIDALAGSGKPLVITTATGCLGDTGEILATEEFPPDSNHPLRFRTLIEREALMGAAKGVRTSVVRPPSFVHGRGGSLFISVLLAVACKTGSSMYIGDTKTSATHVDDLAELYILAMQKAKPGAVINGAGETGITMQILAEAVAENTGAKVVKASFEEAVQGGLPAWIAGVLTMNNQTSNEKAVTEYGWEIKGLGLLNDVVKGSYVQQ